MLTPEGKESLCRIYAADDFIRRRIIESIRDYLQEDQNAHVSMGTPDLGIIFEWSPTEGKLGDIHPDWRSKWADKIITQGTTL